MLLLLLLLFCCCLVEKGGGGVILDMDLRHKGLVCDLMTSLICNIDKYKPVAIMGFFFLKPHTFRKDILYTFKSTFYDFILWFYVLACGYNIGGG